MLKSILRQVIFAKHKLRSCFPAPKVQIGKYRIQATANHPLATYLRRFPLYDQFLPILCSQLEGTVIDIGANIGDTMAAIVDKNPNLTVVCVEPDCIFFKILEGNRQRVDPSGKSVKLVKSFVVDEHANYRIVKNARGTTGNLEKCDQINSEIVDSKLSRSLTFAELLVEIDQPHPTLVKSDTDGFDAKVLHSVAAHIASDRSCSPILFFEMQTYLQNIGFHDPSRADRQADYFFAIDKLHDLGYRHYVAFDNFGMPMIRHTDIDVLKALEQYVSNSQQYRKTPIYFLDIALFQDCHVAVIEKSLELLMRLTCK